MLFRSSQVATASTIMVIADDLESSHNIAALRVKDAVVKSGASLIVISSRYGEVCDFVSPPPAGPMMPSPISVPPADQTGVWLRPAPGGEIATAATLGRLVAANVSPAKVDGVEFAGDGPAEAPGVGTEDLAKAAAILTRAAHSESSLAIIYAPNPTSPSIAGEGAKAAANLALLCRGEGAPASLYVLPTDANVNGIRDMAARPREGGLALSKMLAGGVRALLVIGDNPLMLARGQNNVRSVLGTLDCLITVDSLPTETTRLAHVAFADLPTYAKDGTYTTADRRVVRLSRAQSAVGDQRDCLEILSALATALAAKQGTRIDLPAAKASAIMREIADQVPGYRDAVYPRLSSGLTRARGDEPSRLRVQPVAVPSLPRGNGRFLLTTGRTRSEERRVGKECRL